jgi:hypothetical protein
MPAWLALALVAAAGLLAGYTLGVAQQMLSHDSRTIMASLKVFGSSGNSYTIFRDATWSRLPWAKPCSAGLPRLLAAGKEPAPAGNRRQLCELPSIWKNCSQGIYLDIGTNLGVQLRKLYDPKQFPGAPVLPIFDKAFGKQRSGVCAIGVEANPHHTPYLGTVNAYFHKRGYQAVILTEVAASTRNGTASFFLDADSPVEWGASLTKGGWQRNNASSGAKVEAHVQLLNLPAFVTGIVRPILQQEYTATGGSACAACEGFTASLCLPCTVETPYNQCHLIAPISVRAYLQPQALGCGCCCANDANSNMLSYESCTYLQLSCCCRFPLAVVEHQGTSMASPSLAGSSQHGYVAWHH